MRCWWLSLLLLHFESGNSIEKHACSTMELEDYENGGDEYFNALAETCARECQLEATCAAVCIEDGMLYSRKCNACFGDAGECLLTECGSECRDDIVDDDHACNSCGGKLCFPSFVACTGFAQMGSVRYKLFDIIHSNDSSVVPAPVVLH